MPQFAMVVPMDYPGKEIRTCYECGLEKPLADYYRNSKSRGGYLTRCKSCVLASQIARGKTPQAKARKREYDRRYRDRPGKRQANKERAAAWRVEHPERAAEKVRQWCRNHPERARLLGTASAARRRCRLRQVRTQRVDYGRILQRDGWFCYLCGGLVKRDELSFDHVEPISKGGAHSEANIKVAHLRCNKRKGAKVIVAI